MTLSVILFVTANPVTPDPEGRIARALDEECAAIERELKMTPGRAEYEFRSKWAVTVDELMRHLLELRPTIIHFAGSNGTAGVRLLGDDGRPLSITPAALTGMIRTTKCPARLVVLNACYSAAQATALCDAVGCAVGMKGTISDHAARSFAIAFYRGLGYRRSIRNAYEQAEATLAAKGLSTQAEPHCLARPGVDLDAPWAPDSASEQAPAGGPRNLRRADLVLGAPRAGRGFVEPVTGMEFVWIPGGTFVMGSSLDAAGELNYDRHADDDELPAHPVRLTSFWMSVYPVTNAQYARFIAETGPTMRVSFTESRFTDPAQPVVNVTWDEARAFTAWLSTRLPGIEARLPTEAEWEYAARGSDGRRFPWGNRLPDPSRATYGQNPYTGRPARVGSTPGGMSPFGVHDLAGNVYEWCMDGWTDSYCAAGSSDPCHRWDDPAWARMIRGGSWIDEPLRLRAAYRRAHHSANEGSYRSESIGIRVVCGGARHGD